MNPQPSLATMTERPGYTADGGFRFLELTPSEPASRHCAVVYLHGAGERGDDLSSVKRYGLPAMVASGRASLNCRLICPQLEAEQEWQPERVAAFISYAQHQFGSVGLIGYSLGGQGVCEVLSHYGRISEFAVAIAGRAKSAILVPQLGVSFLAIAGELDSWSSTSSFVEGVRAAGGEAREVVLPAQGHYTSEVALEQPALQAVLALAGMELRLEQNGN